MSPTSMTEWNAAEFSDWLKGQKRDVALVLAIRAAMRSLPVVEGVYGWQRFLNEPSLVIARSFRVAATMIAVVRHPQKSADCSLAAISSMAGMALDDMRAAGQAASRDAVDAPGMAAYTGGLFAEFAVEAVLFAARAGTVYELDEVVTSAVAAIKAASKAMQTDVDCQYESCLTNAVDEDVERLVSGDSSVQELASRPLWSRDMLKRMDEKWLFFKEVLEGLDDGGVFWLDWYECRFEGCAGADRLERACLMLAKDIWQRDTKVMNAAIRQAIAEL